MELHARETHNSKTPLDQNMFVKKNNILLIANKIDITFLIFLPPKNQDKSRSGVCKRGSQRSGVHST